MEWQPIETAPRDGTAIVIVVRYVTASEAYTARWDEIENVWRRRSESEHSGFVEFEYDFMCLGWMPLPEPPKQAP